MAKINPWRLTGSWAEGFALDAHTVSSVFVGYDDNGHERYDTTRTEVGEFLYRLKYKGDQGVVDEIVETATGFIQAWGAAQGAQVVVPVPPSKVRTVQPVVIVATGIAGKLGVPCEQAAVSKTKDTAQLKNVDDHAQRMKMLAGAFTADPAKVEGRSVLLFDDLYQTGATLNAITAALLESGKASKVVVLTLTKAKG